MPFEPTVPFEPTTAFGSAAAREPAAAGRPVRHTPWPSGRVALGTATRHPVPAGHAGPEAVAPPAGRLGDPGLGASLFLRDEPPGAPPAARARPGTRPPPPRPRRGRAPRHQAAGGSRRTRPPALLQTLLVGVLFLLTAGLLVADAVAHPAPPEVSELTAFAAFTGLAVLTSLTGTASWAGGPRDDDGRDDDGHGSRQDDYPAMTATCTLPVALLLPPLYALLAHLPLWLATLPRQIRSGRAGGTGPGRGRFHDAAALGVAGAAAATAHHILAPAVGHGSADRLAGSARGVTALITSAVVYLVVDRLLRPRRWPAGREHTATVAVETCAALVLAVVWAASPVVAFLAVPLVLLLRRGLAHAELLTAARTDAKTRLATMGYWRQVALRETARTRGLGRPLSVLLVDIDHFKQVNDRHGHLNGDVVLLAVADALRHATRPQDLVGRFGGEEFVVLLVDADLATATAVAERIRRTVAATRIHLACADLNVTVSVGVSSTAPAPRASPPSTPRPVALAAAVPAHPGAGRLAETGTAGHDDRAVVTDLLERADTALYRAKREGRNRVCVIETPTMPAALHTP
ncbi:diguanylate cyclase [Frankia sp. EI5c]|uniref:GGDEF domain-containing protein n=1 Tax=Frankia sp. EI5c TaxID=683316 RepID=UPI0026F40AC3|nr:GGDEF domain-containing protein [Frankia sp. EI5c]